MLLALPVVAPLVDPDAPDPAFAVDAPGFRLTITHWPAPEPAPGDRDRLCAASLHAGPAAARLEFAGCPPELAGLVEAAIAGWRMTASSAPREEVELLRLGWLFRAEGTVEVLASARGAVARLPDDVRQTLRERPTVPVMGWMCVERPCTWDCEVDVLVDAGGRTSAGPVRARGSGECPARVHDEARGVALSTRRGYPFGEDGWPAPWSEPVWVTLPRGPRGSLPAGPAIELRQDFPPAL